MAVIIEQAHSVCVEKRVRLFELRLKCYNIVVTGVANEV